MMNRRRTPPSPETVTHTYAITPNDPYDFTMLNFSVLASRGYPVSLQSASRAAVEQERVRWTEDQRTGISHIDNHMKARFEHYKQWMVPSAHHPDMRVLRGGPHKMLFDVPDEVWDILDEHPAEKLAEPTCNGYPAEVNQYHHKLLNGHVPTTVRPMEILGFTGGCFVKAAERARTPGVGAIPEEDVHFIDADTMARYQRFAQRLTERGIRGIGTEALAGLVNDYYALAEQLLPEFAAQKELQPQVPPTPPIEY